MKAAKWIRLCCLLLALASVSSAFGADIYFNDFNGPRGTTYPEWTSKGYTNQANRAGTVPSGSGPQLVTNVDSPNGKQRFLGEFGGPVILAAPPYDPQHFVRIDEAITLSLRNIGPHATVTVTFDLYILKSWDGNNAAYGPDRWNLSVEGGPTLLDTTFSNNFKTGADLSLQNYPNPDSQPQAARVMTNTLGYSFYGDSIYHLTFTFPHSSDTLVLNFTSSLFEGKGIDDESWGLDNVRVATNANVPAAQSAAAAGIGLAQESLGSIYGAALATTTASADSLPLPTHLGNTDVAVIDAAGASRLAPLLYVSPTQINFQVPRGTQTGAATLMILSEAGGVSSATANIGSIAPGLFTANGDGRGVVAATAVRMVGSNLLSPVAVFTCGSTPGSCTALPIELGVDTAVYVSLYGTGIRGAASWDVAVNIAGKAVQVTYAGPQLIYEGLDQVNVALPLVLHGSGETDIILTVGSQSSNIARINIQ